MINHGPRLRYVTAAIASRSSHLQSAATGGSYAPRVHVPKLTKARSHLTPGSARTTMTALQVTRSTSGELSARYATSDRETIGVRRETNLRQPEQRLVRFARGTEAVAIPDQEGSSWR
jgi:hypothetical protein